MVFIYCMFHKAGIGSRLVRTLKLHYDGLRVRLVRAMSVSTALSAGASEPVPTPV